MLDRAQDDPSPQLQEILALIDTRIAAGERESFRAFVRDYYARVDPEDLAARHADDLYGAALSHWRLLARRSPGMPKLRVYNPRIEEHGWQSPHTAIELVNDDMPFLVDSVTMAVNRHGRMLHLIVHPVLAIARNAAGELTGYPAADGRAESVMHLEIDRITGAPERETLAEDLARSLADVRAAVEDWQPMTARMQAVIDEIRNEIHHVSPALPRESIDDALGYLEWLAANHFTFVGYRAHDLVETDGTLALRTVAGSGLGVLRASTSDSTVTPLPAHVRAHARLPELLILTKSNLRSTVHRPGYLDYVGIKRFDASGVVCGEHRFLGLYSSTAYQTPPTQIPLLARKVASVIAAAGLPPASHVGKALAHILDSYPRDELIQSTPAELAATAAGILHLGERQRFRLFVRRDPYERFIVCMIFVPRENYSTELRRKWQTILIDALAGHSTEFDVALSEAPVARVVITVRTTPGAIPAFDAAALEERLERAARRWEDDLRDALVERTGESQGIERLRRFGAGFPVAYRDDFTARAAVADIEMLERVIAGETLGIALYRPLEAAPGTLRFKLALAGAPIALSDSLPMLEHMGFRVEDERPYRIVAAGYDTPLFLDDFGLTVPGEPEPDIETLRPVFEEAFAAVFAGKVESDDFNRLVTAARMRPGDIVILRAYARWLRQIGFTLSEAFIRATLVRHAPVARQLVQLFRLRFDPAAGDAALAERLAGTIEAALDAITNLSEDRVLRQYLAAILATTRTNYFRDRAYVSFKLDPSKVPGVPAPRPMFEIFVYSPRFEGVHLRGGKVARGGLRWSDRPEDFRTEVLGLMKAQMVKNTVIVPVGSKGGFVLKRAAGLDRDALQREGVACYQDYLRGMLDITDNLVAGRIVPPEGVRRLDADDPYLVVAADKGTATFSDYANAIAREYGFWLDDAFASGGSAGYDHKKMAITSRGAWESAKRHFREIGHDIERTPFSVAGIGDMSGDVFGNGMLRSRNIRLVAAFDHRHVFLDPDPPPGAFEERARLFALPRSSWADYDRALISSGGGVWPRDAKSIPLSAEARRVLGIEAQALAPSELVSAILRAPVDCLFNGGIGTFVKAATESHAEAGDRANDATRVDGGTLRCKIVVEGGNLGFTQRGRIEYAAAGGRINTDAIDNSAGVSTSDHEVNIKILLGLALADGTLTVRQRNELLATMTDDVAKLVLRDNTFQNEALALARRIAPELLDGQARFIAFLEKAGRLDRALEALPDEEEIAARRLAKRGLTVPEMAVLLAYSKIWLFDELLASRVPDDPWVATALTRYFPRVLGERFAAYMERHPLRREIIATHVVNSMINRVGSIFVHRLMEVSGAAPADIVRAYLLARETFGYVELWQAVEALEGKVAEDVLAEILLETARRPPATAWFLRSRRLADDLGGTITTFRAGVGALEAALPALLDEAARARRAATIARYAAAGVPAPLAERVAAFEHLGAALDLVETAATTGRSLEDAARVYFTLGTRLGFGWIAERIGALPADTHWQYQAKNAFRDDLAGIQRNLTAQVLAAGEVDAGIAGWLEKNGTAIQRATRVLEELRVARSVDAAMLSVGLRELRSLA